MPVTHRLLRKRMLEPNTHRLLYRLFKHKSRQNRYDIQTANGRQLNVILRILFCLAVGHIPIFRSHYEHLKKSKRRLALKTLRFRLKSLLSASLHKKKQYLANFASLFPFLFSPLFPE